MVTARLKKVITALANGATDIVDVHSQLVPQEPNLTEGAVRRTVQKGKEDGYITSRLYPNDDKTGILAYYSITTAAAEILCRDGDYRIEGIRMQLPYKNCRKHDREVTKVFRAVRQEADRLNLSINIADEYYLRFQPAGFPRKLPPIPDAYLCYGSDRDSIVDAFDVEVDNGTTPTRRLFSKIARLPHRTLLLCVKQSRIQNVITAFNAIIMCLPNSKQKDAERIREKLYLALIPPFCVTGVYGTIWEKIDGTKTQIFRI